MKSCLICWIDVQIYQTYVESVNVHHIHVTGFISQQAENAAWKHRSAYKVGYSESI